MKAWFTTISVILLILTACAASAYVPPSAYAKQNTRAQKYYGWKSNSDYWKYGFNGVYSHGNVDLGKDPLRLHDNQKGIITIDENKYKKNQFCNGKPCRNIHDLRALARQGHERNTDFEDQINSNVRRRTAFQ